MKKSAIIIVLIIFGLLLGSCSKSKSEEIQSYTRDTSSGTREAFFSSIDFKEAIKDDSVLPKTALIVDGNGDMITKIRNDQNAIGYISLSSYNENEVNGLNIDGIRPTDENVLNGTYSLMRGFYYIVTKNVVSDADLLAQAFNAYINTLEAKLIIKSKGGIVDINDSLLKWEDIKVNYPVTLKDNSKTTLRFGGSTSVESIAKALSMDFSIRSGNVKIEHNYTGSSAAYKGTQGSDANSNNLLHVGFSSRNFNDNEKPISNTFGMLAYDAIVTIVNKTNLLTNLSTTTLKDIYLGKYKYFSEVIDNAN